MEYQKKDFSLKRFHFKRKSNLVLGFSVAVAVAAAAAAVAAVAVVAIVAVAAIAALVFQLHFFVFSFRLKRSEALIA